MQNSYNQKLFGLIIATFFISTSGVLGKYIAMPSEVIIFFRAAFAMVFLFLFLKLKKIDLRLKSKKHSVPFVIIGLLTGIHWITYFYALKFSNVAIGMLSLYTFPVIIAFLEPVFLKIKFDPIYIVLGLLVLLGLYILSPTLTFKDTTVQGIIFGLISALCYAIRVLILKKYVSQYNGVLLMFYQTVIITVFSFPVLFFMDTSGFQSQLPYLLLLAILTTAIGHSLMVYSLKFFSASTTSIISSVQPIFGIILAFIFINEIPKLNTLFGGALILATVVIESVRNKKK
ncbi:DMT family transporter [Tenacibaculum amylolyticum]|uniref:DMT family transporter n=1 Tax=Tenacibaculum amylolyticum TaxID=104269 RepID=UPI003894128E